MRALQLQAGPTARDSLSYGSVLLNSPALNKGTAFTEQERIAKITQGRESIDKAIAWAASELEGFMRA